MRSIPLLLVIFWFYFLVPYIGAWIVGASTPDPGRRVRVVGDHVHAVRGGVLLGDHARGHPVDSARAGVGGLRARPQLLADDGARSCCRRRSATCCRSCSRRRSSCSRTRRSSTCCRSPISSVRASKVAQRDGRLVEMYLFAALVYFVMSFALSYVVKRLQQKIAIIR